MTKLGICSSTHLVGHGLEEDAGGGDLLLGREEAVGEVAAVGQVQAHDAAVGLDDSGVDGKVGGRSGVGLDVDAPLLGVESEGREGALLGEGLQLVDELVAAVVPGISMGA